MVSDYLFTQAKYAAARWTGCQLRNDENFNQGRYEKSSMVPIGISCIIIFPVNPKVCIVNYVWVYFLYNVKVFTEFIMHSPKKAKMFTFCGLWPPSPHLYREPVTPLYLVLIQTQGLNYHGFKLRYVNCVVYKYKVHPFCFDRATSSWITVTRGTKLPPHPSPWNRNKINYGQFGGIWCVGRLSCSHIYPKRWSVLGLVIQQIVLIPDALHVTTYDTGTGHNFPSNWGLGALAGSQS